jgi:hypothetical protein
MKMITYYGKWPDVVQAAGEVGMEITDELELTRHYVRIVVYVEEEPRRTEIVSPSGKVYELPNDSIFQHFITVPFMRVPENMQEPLKRLYQVCVSGTPGILGIYGVSVEDVLAQVRSRDWIRPDRLITIYSEYGGKPLWSGY